MTSYKVPRKTAKRGYLWAYHFRHAGKRYKEEGYQTKAESLGAEAKKRREVQARPIRTDQGISLLRLAELYLAECETTKGLAHNTVRQKHFVLSSFVEYLGMEYPAENIAREEVKGYLKVRARISGNCAANRDKKEIKALYNWAITDEEIFFIRNPCKGIPDFPEDDYQRYIPSKTDILKIKLIAQTDERDFLTCMYGLIGRRKEIKNIRWIDVNFQAGWVDLFTRKKGGGLKRMPKPMNEDVRDVLERRFKKRKPGSQAVFQFELKELDRMMPRLCSEANVPVFGFHALRHHAASSLLEEGYPIKVIQFLLGHERQSTTEGYLHIQSGDFHRVVRSLNDKCARMRTVNHDEQENG